jgi:preprotein translocase subunit YajC
MFASPAYASAGAAPSGTAAFMVQILPLLLIFVIFWFLLIRPQQRRLKQHREMIGAVKKNDVAVTGGGVIGRVTKVDENEVELEIAPNVRIKVVKGMISDVKPHGTKPAND